MSTNQKNTGPVLIELDDAPELSPASAPMVPESAAPQEARALERLATLARRRPSRLLRLFWLVFAGLLITVLSVAAWDFALSMLARNIWLGRAVLTGLGLLLFAGFGLALREYLSLMRLRRVDSLRNSVERGLRNGPLAQAKDITRQMMAFYRGRNDLSWALENLKAHEAEILDADALLEITERELMTPLDAAARREVEAAARQVALITAIVPLALADVVVALTANLRMVHRIAEIYGGRAGTLGSWRLLKTVLLHLAATGAVAVGDDLIGSIAGGGVLSKISRRFGEGVVNGALTARVGVAAMEVSRPMPFTALPRPRVTALVKSALAGLFSKG